MFNTSVDDTFNALANKHRRRVLIALLEQEEVVVRKSNSTQEEMTALTHSHLPKLANHNYIDYLHTGDKIRIIRGDNWHEIAEVLQDTKEYFNL